MSSYNIVTVPSPPPLPITDSPNASIPPPHSPLTILFTDIESSSQLWDHDSAAMASAMKAHDGLLRQYMALHAGYEVKQNGDGFMIAFQQPKDALEFCLAVQRALPSGMAGGEDREKAEEGDGDGARRAVSLRKAEKCADKRFRDIKLRMALHHGEVFEQGNLVTKRADYMGPLVNRTARYIQATEPGWVVVSEAFLEALSGEWQGNEGLGGPGESFEIRALGEKEFKGVDGKEKLFVVLPTEEERTIEKTDTTVPSGDVVGRGSVGGELKIETRTL